MSGPYFAAPAALMGDPGRANMLAALMDGRAHTAKELALVAGVSASTASGHLAQLVEGHLVEVVAQGRHRYFRLAGRDVARAIESMMALSQDGPRRHRPVAKADVQLRLARTCYDHLAGCLGVALAGSLCGHGQLAAEEGVYRVTRKGKALFADLGIDVLVIGLQRRAFAPMCLDWSEREPHVAGALGAALAARCFDLRWIVRRSDTRAIRITPLGEREFRRRFGIVLEEAGVKA
jgi:DNA-binding transcriptional ArsR family regulator